MQEITERAVAFIEKNRDKPFFCYIAHNSIHSPEKEKKELIAKYAAKPNAKENGSCNPVQAAMIETLDKSVGKILKKLKKLNLEKDTIVIFFSDNGRGPKERLAIPWMQGRSL